MQRWELLRLFVLSYLLATSGGHSNPAPAAPLWKQIMTDVLEERGSVRFPDSPGTHSVATVQSGKPALEGGNRAGRPPGTASDNSSFTVAHIASPLVRHRLPGQAPFPGARARASIHLLKAALDRASDEGADAIALTGSIVSAPPPLRQCDKGGYYKHPDAAAALEEATADYVAVRTLLEESGLPYAVTPGAEDCMEAFESVFSLEPSATTVRAQAVGMTREAAEQRRRRQQAQTVAEGTDHADEAQEESWKVDPYDDPNALSKQAIHEFKTRLKSAKEAARSSSSARARAEDETRSTQRATALGSSASDGDGTAKAAASPSRLKGGGVDLEDIGESCCGSGAAGGGGCGGGGDGSGDDGNHDDEAQSHDDASAGLDTFPGFDNSVADAGSGGAMRWDQVPGVGAVAGAEKSMGSFVSGQDTPQGETPERCVLARLPDHVPPRGMPQRLEYERRLMDWLLSPEAQHTPQCHVQTFAPVPFSLAASSEPSSAATVQETTPPAASGDALGPTGASYQHLRRKGCQEEGVSAQDGAVFYEHESLRSSLEASGKMILCLYSLGVGQSEDGVAVRGCREGRVTYVGAPSLAIPPHRFVLHRLRGINESLTMDPRVSRSADELRAKAEMVRHRHFWGHRELALGAFEDSNALHVAERAGSRALRKRAAPVVFLDRDGVINTLASYNTGPAAMELIPGAAWAIARLQQAGCKIVIISSQACVGKGFVRTSDVNSVMDRMCRLLRQDAQRQLSETVQQPQLRMAFAALNDLAQPDAIIFSVGAGAKAIHPDYRDISDAKPSPAGLLKGAACVGVNADTMDGFMVGDRLSDLLAGVAAGCRVVLVKTGMGAQSSQQLAEPGGVGAARDSIMSNLLGEVPDLAAAADLILASMRQV